MSISAASQRAALTDGTSVFIVNKYVANDLEKVLAGWRSDQLAQIYASDVAALTITYSGSRVALAHTGNLWTLTDPINDLAERERAEGLVSDLGAARIKEFVDAPGPLREYGLDPRELDILIVRRGENAAPIQLELGSRRDPENLRRLMASLGRSVGQATRGTELAKDVGGTDGPIAKETLSAYLTSLNRLHLIDDSAAWLPHMRSRARLRTAPVRYFVDPSLGPASLGVGSDELTSDLNALGLHFEALVVRDLRIYAQPLDARVDSWRDSNGNGVDAVVTAGPDRWGAFEVKLDPRDVDAAAASLLRFSSSVDKDHHGPPACLGVITSTGAGGLRDDGVHVIPIGCLGP